MKRLQVVLALFALLMAVTAGRAAGKERIDFHRDIRPILSEACFQCHGPDDKARKASLRFDKQEGAFRTRDGITTIVPGMEIGRAKLPFRISDPPAARRPANLEDVAFWPVRHLAELIQHWTSAVARL